MAEIQFDRVSKRFGQQFAVRNLNLTVHDKELLTLVGPSGCGKSTTLNMLAGLEDPTEGAISIDGRVVNDVPSGARDIAMVFQSYALYPHMTVRQNIGFGLEVRGMPKREIAARVDRASEMLGIAHLLDRRPRELSGGQRQRVALGRALTRDPKVFLLDEPLSNLDAQLRTQMRAELKLLFTDVQGTVVYVTHDQAEAMTLSDRIVVMKDGDVQQVGTPLDVYNTPENAFVARFLGSPSITMVPGHLTMSDGKPRFVTDGLNFALSPRLAGAAGTANGGGVVFGVRPEDVRVSLTDDGGVPARVNIVEPMGSMNVMIASVGQNRFAAVTPPDLFRKTGDPIWLRFDLDKAHLFDGATETRLRSA